VSATVKSRRSPADFCYGRYRSAEVAADVAARSVYMLWLLRHLTGILKLRKIWLPLLLLHPPKK
jgi:hypothetical protein